MADETLEMTIRCLCGDCKLTRTIPNKPVEAWFCSCKGCRHVMGTLWFIDIPWALPLPPISSLKRFVFSPMAWNYFCSTCGCSMFWFSHRDQNLYVNSGTLDEPELLDIKYCGWQWLGSTGDGGAAEWLTHVNGKELTRWKRHKFQSDQLPKGWNIAHNPPEFPREETVRAHCRCEGVDFLISRPKDRYTPEDLCGLDSPASPHDWLNPKGDKYVGGLCACTSCRLSSGLDVVQWAFIPKANILSPNGQPFDLNSGTLKWYQSSVDVKRYFCGTCGAFTFWDCEERPALIDVAVGLLHSVSGARAEGWLEYRKDGVLHAGDAVNKTLVNAIDKGYKAWLSENDPTA